MGQSGDLFTSQRKECNQRHEKENSSEEPHVDLQADPKPRSSFVVHGHLQGKVIPLNAARCGVKRLQRAGRKSGQRLKPCDSLEFQPAHLVPCSTASFPPSLLSSPSHLRCKARAKLQLVHLILRDRLQHHVRQGEAHAHEAVPLLPKKEQRGQRMSDQGPRAFAQSPDTSGDAPSPQLSGDAQCLGLVHLSLDNAHCTCSAATHAAGVGQLEALVLRLP
jgi:hypothetical protein